LEHTLKIIIRASEKIKENETTIIGKIITIKRIPTKNTN